MDSAVNKVTPILRELTLTISRALGETDKDGLLKDIKKNPAVFAETTDAFKGDKDVVYQAVSRNGMMLEHASSEMRNDKEIFLAAVRKHHKAVAFASEDLRKTLHELAMGTEEEYMGYDYKVVSNAVNRNGLALEFATDEWKDDKNLALVAVAKHAEALQFVSERLRNDVEVVQAAIRNNNEVVMAVKKLPYVLEFTPFQNSAPIKKNGLVLEFASQDVKENKDVVLEAIRKSPPALRFASTGIRKTINECGLGMEEWRGNDREAVLVAVNQRGHALEYASIELQGNPDIVLAAVRNRWSALQFASESTRNDKEIILTAIVQDGQALQYASKLLQNDPEVVLAALKQKPEALRYASRDILQRVQKCELASGEVWAGYDKNKALSAVQKDGLALQFVSDELKSNTEVVLAALKTSPTAVKFASPALCLAFREAGLASADEWKGADRKVVFSAVRKNGLALEFASDDLRSDRQIVLVAVKQNEMAREYALGKTKEELDALHEKLEACGVPECFRELVASGFDNVDMLNSVNDDDLASAGLGRGHIIKFRNHVKR